MLTSRPSNRMQALIKRSWDPSQPSFNVHEKQILPTIPRAPELGYREIDNLLTNNQRQRCTCSAVCLLLYPVLATRTSVFRMDSDSASYGTGDMGGVPIDVGCALLRFQLLIQVTWGVSRSMAGSKSSRTSRRSTPSTLSPKPSSPSPKPCP